MAMKRRAKVVAPEWMLHLSDDGRLNAREILKMFGYTTGNSINTAVVRGHIPPPDGYITKHGTQVKYWTVKTIRDFIK